MVLLAALIVLLAFALAYWGFAHVWRAPAKALGAIIAAFVLLGAAFGVMQLAGRT